MIEFFFYNYPNANQPNKYSITFLIEFKIY